MKKYLLILLLSFIPFLSFSQRTEYYYFDENWKATSSYSNYSYYRKIQYDYYGSVIVPIKDYYKNGTVQSIFISDKVNLYGIKYGGSIWDMGMWNGILIQDGYAFYYRNGQFVFKESEYTFYNKNNTNNSNITLDDVKTTLEILKTGIEIYKFFTK